MDENDLISTIENYFIALAKIDFVPFPKKSLSLVLVDIRKKNINERDITDLLDLLLSKVAAYKCEALDDIGIKNSNERPKVLTILDQVNLEKLKEVLAKNETIAVSQINSIFLKNSLTSKIDAEHSKNIFAGIKKVKYSNNALINIKLILSHGMVEEVLPYEGRYGNASLQVIQKCVDELATIRVAIINPDTDIDALKIKVVAFLKEVGHTEISLKDKNVDELSQIMIYHYFVLKALLRARQEGMNTTISKDLLTDYVAIEIVRESEIS